MHRSVSFNMVSEKINMWSQHANKVVSDSPRLEDIPIGLLNSLNRKMKFFGEFNLQKNCNQSCLG